ncbi:MAG: hypothetical protein RI539_04805 [Spiribacter sp.]|jgi:hypothetical protein|nr:hypothetical protein [Spiribacter sp.]MDR9489649.1 hypothetical protein [Spiribacter sp.]
MHPKWVDERGDLYPGSLQVLSVTLIIAVPSAMALTLLIPDAKPGSPLLQVIATIGSLCFLVPYAFSIKKRCGMASQMPRWFSAHVIATTLGLVLISIHVGAGDLLSPPGAAWALAVALVVQGLFTRTQMARQFSAVFASRPQSFAPPDPDIQVRIGVIIKQKEKILKTLDSTASEAVFSPNLRHFIRHPLLTLRYALLAGREAHYVGRHKAGLLVAFWRRTHVALALLFLIALVAHVIIVLFFAGYAAGDGPIDWWHITALGR